MDKTLAFVFPGQGSQSLGMLTYMAQKYDAVLSTFSQASAVLGYDLWQLVQQGSEQQLNQTEHTQPALLTAAVAVWRVWCEQTERRPGVMAGHSLGEYTALVCADAIDFDDAVALVAKRGQFMQNAVPQGAGAMAAIIGLDDAAVAEVCIQSAENDVLAPANFNSPGQVVIAGTKNAVERACDNAKQAGAKRAIVLPVSVPSHCQLMQPAAKHLQAFIEKLTIKTPRTPVIHNVDVKQYDDVDSIRQALIQQLTCPVHWSETTQLMAEQGIKEIIECGPGRVLWGLNRRIDKSLNNKAIYNLDSLEVVLKEE